MILSSEEIRDRTDKFLVSIEAEDLNEMSNYLHSDFCTDNRYTGSGHWPVMDKEGLLNHYRTNEFPYHTMSFTEKIYIVEGNMISQAYILIFTKKDTGERSARPFMGFTEFKDGLIYRSSFMTDRLGYFLDMGYISYSQSEKAVLRNYVKRLMEEGILEEDDDF